MKINRRSFIKIGSLTTMGLPILGLRDFEDLKESMVNIPIHDTINKTVIISDKRGDLILRINYSKGCVLDKIQVNGKEVVDNGNVAYSGVKLADQSFSSKDCLTPPVIITSNKSVNIKGIKFGNSSFSIEEEWIFKIEKSEIQWEIIRQYNQSGSFDEIGFPYWEFNSIETWDGAMLDNGGVAWNSFLREPGETFGTHAATLTFWNRENNSCLLIRPDNNNNAFKTATFSHNKDHVLSVVQSSSTEPINTKYGLRRFLQTGERVFAPIEVNKSEIRINCTLKALSYDQAYDRGTLKGISEGSINEMLNTIGRYGVVDEYLYGSNGWRSGFAVLQEPWLALYGLAINSPDFINGFSKTLEFQKDHAILSNGRVLPRWHYTSADAMPDSFQDNGFYECQWGYMLDSQPAYAINVAEQFDMTGDMDWLRQFKPVCEKVLDYIIKRDSDGNGLFEVVQNTHKEEKGTDWLDVIWASYEVASINALMYKALVRWSELEKLLGDEEMSGKYQQLALKLKIAFNKDITDGGFWNSEKKWYVHWREPDGSVYGNNLVSMVNFLSIGYGICDDSARKDSILDSMEELMEKEKLFVWPSCFFPYEDNTGLNYINYPYPNYENGDLFLAWAELGTRCYAEKKPEIALKYIRNVINQYEVDGLAYQRYTRIKQTGVGDDILSNNVMAVVGLYRNIYGVQPQYNRLYLEPHLTTELNGTQLKYWLRNQNYTINLSKEKYSISVNSFTISDKNPFAINCEKNVVKYYNGKNDFFSLQITSERPCSIDILLWEEDNLSWKECGDNSKNKIYHEIHHLKPKGSYQILVNGKFIKNYIAASTGIIHFELPASKDELTIQVLGKI